MSKGNYEHGEHGWFKSKPRAYGSLLSSEAVQMLAQSYPPKGRDTNLYQFLGFLQINSLGPEELLALDDKSIKMAIRKAILNKTGKEHYAAARRVFYVVRRFLELNDREIHFNHTEKKALLRYVPKKITQEYVPTREDIYRMVDSAPNRLGHRQQSRARAIVICLWQSGVRGSCLCSWPYGMFKNQLYPDVKASVVVKVVANRPKGVGDCAEDTKLSSYSVNYYYTFLHEEAAWALRTYLDERKADGWQPKDSDPVFVTEGSVSKNGPLETRHLLDVVKNCAEQIGIAPSSIWTHCLRKAFRKTLYRSGLDSDVAEALMGHKLPGSRGSYFDYHDVKFAMEQYIRGFWNRADIDRVEKLEQEVGEHRQALEIIKTFLTEEQLQKLQHERARKTYEGQIEAKKQEG